ncbi:sigma-54 dependent transcriptional regulator [Zoogloea sp.]|uniref:sigma-54-dependent transcriptional regulator n=1 Tax=Zoogloea sp. TaxID=49181 RepID=UPI00261FEFCE|nr:sigma-54 dependent transcriptional regulator [Zoogloea sp.]
MTPELRALIIEDDPDVRLGCEQAMMLADIPVEGVGSAEEGFQRLKPGFPGVVVTDMRLPKADGMEVLHRCQAMDADLPVIIITGHGDVTLAVEAMRAGAYDFIQKPFSPELLVDVVRRALEKRALTLEVLDLRRRLEQREGAEAKLIGRSPQMARVRQLVTDVASTRVDVLVRGETGTGKELIAQCLHELSPRKDGPFVALNCGGLPDNLLDSELFGHEAGAFTGAQKRRIGKIEYANKGTLFLDELESMPMGVQIKLLRVLQERVVERLGSNQQLPVDCRVVAATKDDLKDRAERQTFRADLYYRLNVVTIDLPPLRERREDIPLLLEHFLLLAAHRHERPLPAVPPEQMRKLMAHTWPGNVRELRNVADCIVLGVGKDILGTATGEAAPASLAESVESFERSLIAAELRRHGGSLARSAEALRIPKTTLHDKIRKYGLQGGEG